MTAVNDLTESVTIEIPADGQASVKELQTIITWKIVVHRADADSVDDVGPRGTLDWEHG